MSVIAGTCLVSPRAGVAETTAGSGRIAAGGVLRIHVPEAVGGKTVIGELTVDSAVGAGFVTAYGCASGLPVSAGVVTRSDVNYDGRLTPVASNRLLVKADDNGDVCLFTLAPAALIVDVNAVTFDTGVNSFPNRRTDTRAGPLVAAGRIERINVPEAQGAKTVVGQLTIDRATGPGFVTAYACAAGLPVDAAGRVSRSDRKMILVGTARLAVWCPPFGQAAAVARVTVCPRASSWRTRSRVRRVGSWCRSW